MKFNHITFHHISDSSSVLLSKIAHHFVWQSICSLTTRCGTWGNESSETSKISVKFFFKWLHPTTSHFPILRVGVCKASFENWKLLCHNCITDTKSFCTSVMFFQVIGSIPKICFLSTVEETPKILTIQRLMRFTFSSDGHQTS